MVDECASSIGTYDLARRIRSVPGFILLHAQNNQLASELQDIRMPYDVGRCLLFERFSSL